MVLLGLLVEFEKFMLGDNFGVFFNLIFDDLIVSFFGIVNIGEWSFIVGVFDVFVVDVGVVVKWVGFNYLVFDKLKVVDFKVFLVFEGVKFIFLDFKL